MNFSYNISLRGFFAFLFLLMLCGACQREEGCLDSGATNYDVSADLDCCCEFPELKLRVFRMADGMTYSSDSLYQDASGNDFRILDARFYLSNFHLVRNDGTEVGVTDSLTIELQDGSRQFIEDNFTKINPDQNLYDIGEIVTQGGFTKVKFLVGLFPEVNHSNPDFYANTHPLAIQSDSLHISREEGYKFNVLDIFAANDTTIYAVSGDQQAVEVELDYEFTVVKAFDLELQIDVDLTRLLENVDFLNDDFNTVMDKIVNNTPAAFNRH